MAGGGEAPGAVRELARELGGAGGAALRGAARAEARARGARAEFAGEARAAAAAALGLAAAPRRRALVPFGRWAFFEGEVCGAAGGLVARLADGHFAELTAPQAAALLEQRAGEAPGAWGLHIPPPAAAGGGGAPGVPRGGAGGKAAGPSAAPPPRLPPPGPSPGAISAAGASPAAEAAPAPPPAADAAAGPGSRAPAFHVQVREVAAAGQGDSSPSRGGRAGPAPGAAEPKLRSKFAQEFARR